MRKFILSMAVMLSLAVLGSHMSAQNPPGGYTSPAQGGTSANAIVNNPTATQQTITPGDTTSVPLTILGASGTSVDLFDVKINGGSKAFAVDSTGTTFTVGTGSAVVNCGTVNCTVNGAAGGTFAVTIGGTGSVNLNVVGDIRMGQGVGAHVIMNNANGDFAGKLTCAANVATKTFGRAFTSTPNVIVFNETTKGGTNLTAISNTAFTVSCTGATDINDYIVVGNPN